MLAPLYAVLRDSAPVKTMLAALRAAVAFVWLSPGVAAAVEFTAPPTLAQVAAWIVDLRDNAGQPFVIVDKRTAEIAVYDGSGRKQGAAAALLGRALGDEIVPGIALRDRSTVRPDERRTPAGRFPAVLGPAREMPEVLWLDVENGFAIHAVFSLHPEELRRERLRSLSRDDNRITTGCVNVSSSFYRDVIRPTFWLKRGVVYILPDTRSLSEVFPAFGAEGGAPH